jgi:shikimate dehydrogenase
MKRSYDLEDLKRWHGVSADDEPPIRLGVFGDPVEHSRSPQMQNAALRHCGINTAYARFHITRDQVSEALRIVRDLDFVGVNLTIPHKSAALEFIDHVDPAAAAIGAINTVRVSDGRMTGFNTDAAGFGAAVQSDFGISLRGLRVLILGSGGAARAIRHQCSLDACADVRSWSRGEGALTAVAVDQADLIVNATPVGLSLADRPLVTRDMLRAHQFVFDTIYEPARTKLLDEAAAAGAKFTNGLSMLLHQGGAAFELWFRQPAPIDVMRAALVEP